MVVDLATVELDFLELELAFFFGKKPNNAFNATYEQKRSF
jgi:hypothetical protein